MTDPQVDDPPTEEKSPAEVAREAADIAAAAAAEAAASASQAESEEAALIALVDLQRQRGDRYEVHTDPVLACRDCGVAVVNQDVHDVQFHPLDWRTIADPVAQREARFRQRERERLNRRGFTQ